MFFDKPGQLVTITSQGENVFVQALITLSQPGDCYEIVEM